MHERKIEELKTALEREMCAIGTSRARIVVDTMSKIIDLKVSMEVDKLYDRMMKRGAYSIED